MLRKLHTPDLSQQSTEACLAEAMSLFELKYITDPWEVATKLFNVHIGTSNEFKRKTKKRGSNTKRKMV